MSRPVTQGETPEERDLTNLNKAIKRAKDNVERSPAVREQLLSHYLGAYEILSREKVQRDRVSSTKKNAPRKSA